MESDRCFNISLYKFRSNDKYVTQMTDFGTTNCDRCLGNPQHCHAGFTISMTFTIKAISLNGSQYFQCFFYNNKMDNDTALSFINQFNDNYRYWFEMKCISPHNMTHNLRYYIRWKIVRKTILKCLNVIIMCPPKQPDMEAYAGTLRLKPNVPLKKYRQRAHIPLLYINGHK